METAIITNTATVQKCYNYFLTGNIPGLLDECTNDIKWSVPGSRDIPWAGDREGKPAVGEFFKIVNDNIEFLKFEPREYVEQGNRVVALGYWEGKARKTGKTAKGYWAMAFTFKNGKVAQFQEYSDTETTVKTLTK